MTDNGYNGSNGQVYLVSAARTPIGKFDGALADVPATTLGGIAIRAAVERAGVPTDQIDEVLMGQVLQAGVGQAPARQAALKGGLADSDERHDDQPRLRLGPEGVMLAAAEIRAGDAEIVVAGGMENMNQGPYLIPKARFGYRLGNAELIDATVHDGLWCTHRVVPHGHPRRARGHQEPGQPRRTRTSSRCESHQKAPSPRSTTAASATRSCPVPVRTGKETVDFDTDEGPRRDTTHRGARPTEASLCAA